MNWQIIKRGMVVGIGGFIGGGCRQAIELLFAQQFPVGTIIINLSGTFLSVLLVTILSKYWHVAQWVADFLLVGVLGAYTTYSTAMLDIVKVPLMIAIAYWLISVIGGVTMVYLARWAVRDKGGVK
ncbi:CrcB family protein [Weissella diestrammenae]|uniref:Fluoride-specific ion channel FluC n=1 Tax=Weissella diestrammenae TaxID=1162633 RepID=A0A7G9T680_9LACO|nr:CrcB family protein [Weissella diestrammenae]MCM0583351.1 CrcB family protein [Weissella diestrammenae]QNN75605.1 CrcB family protein [Weissella diestrammenae]